MAHAFNANTWEAESGESQFGASLAYKSKFQGARTTEKLFLKTKPNPPKKG